MRCLSEDELDELVRRVKKPGARRLRRWWQEETRPALLHEGGPATTAESLHLALALAAEAAQQVGRAVMEAVLRGPGLGSIRAGWWPWITSATTSSVGRTAS
ncbi:Uncharacterised protein [Chromobacterium violaceum]|uniref:Uncharacterized protein n=1 Tax=Chromobacterium violaceum TaxID=536 RepID=A0A447T607_CHRVL|nr:Uncharacterised protein [Chromobacterium violaceum]